MGRRVGQIVVAGLCFTALATVAAGQSTTTSTRTTKFEIIAVDGNNVVVRTPTGTRELTLPDDFKMTVNGQPVSVHDLKPGMAGTAEVTTTTTMKPVTVTEVKNGTVMKKVGNSIIVRTADNQMKMFSEADVEKRQARIVKDGQPVSIADLNEGDRLTATIVTERPPQVMTEQQVNATLTPG